MPTKKKRPTRAKRSKTRAKTVRRGKSRSRAKMRSASPTTAVRNAFTKSQILEHIAAGTDLTRKQVSMVLDELHILAHRHLRSGGAGEFTIPGLLKCVVKHKPATKSRRGINPFTGEMTTFKAKPARNVVKIRALKKLKEMVK